MRLFRERPFALALWRRCLLTLIAYISEEKNDLIGRQYCAMAVGNLAAEAENHDEIVKSDAITVARPAYLAL